MGFLFSKLQFVRMLKNNATNSTISLSEFLLHCLALPIELAIIPIVCAVFGKNAYVDVMLLFGILFALGHIDSRRENNKDKSASNAMIAMNLSRVTFSFPFGTLLYLNNGYQHLCIQYLASCFILLS